MSIQSESRGLMIGRIFLALPFAAAGLTKLMGLPMHVEGFARWGYPAFFLYVVGAAELAFALGLLGRRTAGLAAAGLVAVMLGAVGTHVVHAEWGAVVPPLVLGAGAALVARAYVRLRGRGVAGLVPSTSAA